MLDDLRKSAMTEDEFDFDDEDIAISKIQDKDSRDKYFLGLRPVERMMLSIFLFLNVTILMVAFLLATGRLVL